MPSKAEIVAQKKAKMKERMTEIIRNANDKKQQEINASTDIVEEVEPEDDEEDSEELESEVEDDPQPSEEEKEEKVEPKQGKVKPVLKKAHINLHSVPESPVKQTNLSKKKIKARELFNNLLEQNLGKELSNQLEKRFADLKKDLRLEVSQQKVKSSLDRAFMNW